MVNKSINFKQERDFGDLFNATFSFIAQEYKRLGTAILYFTVPFMLLSSIATTFYFEKNQEITQSLKNAGNSDPMAIFSKIGSLFGYIGLMSFFTIIASTILFCTVFGYIKLYVRGGEDFTVNDVWREAMKNFWRLLGASIVVGLVVGIGFVLCIIPGIYLGVALSIIFCILVFEEKNFSESFSRSLKLINTNWWFTFGVVIVSTIIIYILSALVSVPSFIMGFKSLFSNMKNFPDMNMQFSVGFYVVNSITQLISSIFLVIPVILTAFLYYSFVEKVEKPSLMEKIDQINDNE